MFVTKRVLVVIRAPIIPFPKIPLTTIVFIAAKMFPFMWDVIMPFLFVRVSLILPKTLRFILKIFCVFKDPLFFDVAQKFCEPNELVIVEPKTFFYLIF